MAYFCLHPYRVRRILVFLHTVYGGCLSSSIRGVFLLSTIPRMAYCCLPPYRVWRILVFIHVYGGIHLNKYPPCGMPLNYNVSDTQKGEQRQTETADSWGEGRETSVHPPPPPPPSPEEALCRTEAVYGNSGRDHSKILVQTTLRAHPLLMRRAMVKGAGTEDTNKGSVTVDPYGRVAVHGHKGVTNLPARQSVDNADIHVAVDWRGKSRKPRKRLSWRNGHVRGSNREAEEAGSGGGAGDATLSALYRTDAVSRSILT